MVRRRQAGQAGKKKPCVRKKSSQKNASFYLDHIDDSLIVINAKQEIIKVNREFSKLWGYSSEEVLGTSVFNLFPEDEISKHRAEMEKAIATKKPRHFETTALTKSREKMPLAIKGSAFFDSGGKLEGFIAIFRDITKRRLAEEKLRETEERIRTIYESAFEGILIHEHGRILDANPAVTKMFGYSLSELIGMNGFDTVAEESRELVKENVRSEYELPYEAVGLRKDGTTFFMEIYGKKLLYKGRQVRVAAVRDITERKRSEEKLRESESFVKLVLDNLPIGIAVNSVDPTVTFDYMNSNFPKFYRTTKEKLAHPDAFWDAVYEDPEFREEIKKKVLDDCASGDPKRMYWIDVPITRKGYETAYISARNIPIPNKQLMISTVWDVTERKKAEERFKHLIRNAPIAISIINIDGRVEYTNEKYVEVTGYKMEDNPTLKRWWASVYPDKEYRKDVISKWDAFINKSSTGEEAGIHERQIVCKDGTIKDIELQFTRVGDKVIVVLNDTTERKRLEAQLRHSQKMEAVGKLAGGVAHDFNNILTAIMGYGNLMQMKMKEDDPLRMNVDQILTSAERAAHLTQSLLAFSRKQIRNPQPIDLNEVITRVEKLLLRVIGEDIKLKTVLIDEDLTVMADSGQIEQILMNLATNARDSMPDGGLLIIGTGHTEIDEEFTKAHGYGKPGKYAHISVTDSGEGMDEGTRQRIFEPFFTTKELGKGTGLGLSMVYGIIKQHDGFIDVYSEPGKGTKFKIYLPAIKAEVKEAEIPEPSSVQGGTETVLVAEDDESVRRFIKAILKQYGYRVIEAGDGEEAIEKYKEREEEIDLLLLDVMMPKRKGKEVYDEIKGIKPDVKALFLSGYSEGILQKEGVLEKGLNLLFKPVAFNDLLRKVRDVLDK